MTAVNSFVVRFIITVFTSSILLLVINSNLPADNNIIKGNADNLTVRAKDADIRDLLMALSEISGRDIIIDPSVKGRVTLYLKNVTWREVLDAVLFFNNLGYVEMSSNGIVSPYDKMERIIEEMGKNSAETLVDSVADKRIVTITYPMTFDEAKSLWPEIRLILTPEGKYQYNRKTNCAQVVDTLYNAKRVIDLITLKRQNSNDP